MRKKLFAILMSAMMMVTFMPAMAFAAASYDKPVWNADYTHVDYTVTDGTDVYTDGSNANRYAHGTTGDKATSSDAFNGWVYSVAKNENFETSYLDLNFAKVKMNARLSLSDAQVIWGDNFDKASAAQTLVFSVPTYAGNYNTAWTGEKVVGDMTKEMDATALRTLGFTFKVAAPAYDSAKKYEDQTFELAVLPTVEVLQSTNETTPFVGSVPTVKVTIKKETASAANATYAFTDKFNRYYDGAEHTFEQVAMTGVTSTYELFNKTTGKYEAVDAIKVKNVGTYYYKATAKDSKGTAVHYDTIVVSPSCKAKVAFKKQSFNVAGSFDAKNFVKVSSDEVDDEKSAEKAIATDSNEIMAFFNDYYEITSKDGVKYVIGKKEALTEDAVAEKAVLDKYATLMGNYDGVFATGYADFVVVDDIEFTKAPLTKTYKAKTLKKASKSFQINAKASSGSSVYYMLTKGAGKIKIDKATGKVTVKKGLKKGTYKVGVYAISLDNDLYNTYTLKIKVK